MEYKQLITNTTTKHVWENSFCNEIGRLTKGYKNKVTGTETMYFINFQEIPQNSKQYITYGRIVVDYRPQKEETHRTRLTVGGNFINYPDTFSSPTDDMSTVKLLWNSVISTPGAKFCTMDIANFYLGTKMSLPEYMMLPLDIIPLDIKDQYKLHLKQYNNKVYVRIDKGMYGLPHAGLLENKKLVSSLHKDGYYPCEHTVGLWKHRWLPIKFTLVVDYFVVHYKGQEHVQHLHKCLLKYYNKVTVDWEGGIYCGITLDWKYGQGVVDIIIPGYITNLLHKYQHPIYNKKQLSPHPWTKPMYGQQKQFPDPPYTTPLISKQMVTRLQQILGTLLYYARMVDTIILVAINTMTK